MFMFGFFFVSSLKMKSSIFPTLCLEMTQVMVKFLNFSSYLTLYFSLLLFLSLLYTKAHCKKI